MIEPVTATLDAPAPLVGWASGALGAVQAADREIARQSALRYRAIAAFAATRPASGDRAQGSPGAMSSERWAARPEVLRPVSEWATQELVVALSISSEAAELLLTRSLTLVHRLPATLDALGTGALHVGHLGPLLDKVAPIADDAVRARLERDLLAWATRQGVVCTPAQLRDKARREVLRRGARSAADDLARAIKERGLSVRPDRCDGMSVVSALLTTPEAAALMAALSAYADALPDDGRTRGQRMADCLLDLVLRPGESGLPPVLVTLDVVAPVGALLGGDQPCEIDGQVVPAEVVRALLAALTGQQVTVRDTEATDAKAADAEAAESQPVDDTSAADTAPAGSAPAQDASAAAGATHLGTDSAEELPPGLPDWEAAELAALDAWWSDLQRRVAAGEFDADPAPSYSDDLGPPDLGPPPDAPPDDEPAEHPTQSPEPPTDGWWARADRAVDQASDALVILERALGHARRTVATAERADAADEAAWAGSPAGRVTAAPDSFTALAAASDDARELLADLLGRTAGGGLADRPRLVLTDALSGAMLALTDLPALRRAARNGTGLTAPRQTAGYRPGAALDRHVRARDRRCRFPGCRRRVPKSGELDHTVPWPAGPTSAANLAGFCTGHHRGKHQAPGWTHTLRPDGTLTVTTPTGLTATTTPPPW